MTEKDYKHLYYIEHKQQVYKQSRRWKEAHREQVNEAKRREYYNRSPEERERILVYRKALYQRNAEKECKRSKEWARENRAKVRNKEQVYNQQNREKIRARHKRNRDTRPSLRIRAALSTRLNGLLHGLAKTAHTMEIVGCTTEELRAYFEMRFKSGMCWDNYGIRGWHIDHIRPCASFDLTDPEQQRICFNYTNLQPLWAEENQRKGDKLETDENCAHPLRWGMEER